MQMHPPPNLFFFKNKRGSAVFLVVVKQNTGKHNDLLVSWEERIGLSFLVLFLHPCDCFDDKCFLMVGKNAVIDFLG